MCTWLCPSVGFVLASGFVLAMGLVLKWTGTSLAGTSMLLLAAGGGFGGATIAGICTFRHACFGRMVLDQNAWRPGLQMPQPIGNRDPAILQAAEVNSIITRERHAARIRTRMIVSRLAAATANRINNSMTVILGSIDIADNRGFGMDFHREIQGVRDGVEDTRQVCQRLLGLSVRGDTRSRRTNVESHVRDLESKLAEMVEHAGFELSIHISKGPLRVQVSPRLMEDWIIQATQFVLAQCEVTQSIGIVVGRYCKSNCPVIIEVHVESKDGLSMAPQLRFAAVAMGGKMEQGVTHDGKAYYRLIIESLDPLDGVPSDGPDHELATLRKDRKILVVEDDPQVRKLIRGMLGGYAQSIVDAEDGWSGWEQIETHSNNLELAVVDVVLPGISGVELAERIRERYPKIPVLLVTGHDQVEGADIFRSDEKVAILGKPFAKEQLTRAISRLSLEFGSELACQLID